MILLDTHALIWWVNGSDRLSVAAQEAIQHELNQEDGLILVSTISAWEIALLVQKERLTLTMSVDDWLGSVQAIRQIQFVPPNIAIMIESTRLPGSFHPDPADRMIVATARHFNAPLITADGKILAYTHVHTIG